MCNRLVKSGKIIKPGERVRVFMKGPGAVFELPFDDAVFWRPSQKREPQLLDQARGGRAGYRSGN